MPAPNNYLTQNIRTHILSLVNLSCRHYRKKGNVTLPGTARHCAASPQRSGVGGQVCTGVNC